MPQKIYEELVREKKLKRAKKGIIRGNSIIFLSEKKLFFSSTQPICGGDRQT
jgi:hypothetical protein